MERMKTNGASLQRCSQSALNDSITWHDWRAPKSWLSHEPDEPEFSTARPYIRCLKLYDYKLSPPLWSNSFQARPFFSLCPPPAPSLNFRAPQMQSHSIVGHSDADLPIQLVARFLMVARFNCNFVLARRRRRPKEAANLHNCKPTTKLQQAQPISCFLCLPPVDCSAFEPDLSLLF